MLVVPPPCHFTLPRYRCYPRWAHPHSFYLHQGQRYLGVTTILRATQSPEAQEQLARWQAEVGAVEAERIRRASAERGRQLHQELATYWHNGRETPMTLRHQPWGYWKSLEPVLADMEAVHLVEGFVWHPSGFAGLADALVTYKGELCLCDWKTSAKPKNRAWIQDYCLQVAAYTAAVNRVYQSSGVRVKRGLIVIALPNTEAQVFELKSEELMTYWHQFQARFAQLSDVNTRR